MAIRIHNPDWLLAKILTNIVQLVEQKEKFEGDKNSRNYRYLEEMISRNLLSLDELDLQNRNDLQERKTKALEVINHYLEIRDAKSSDLVTITSSFVEHQ